MQTETNIDAVQGDLWLFTGANGLKQWSLKNTKPLVKDFGTNEVGGWINALDYNLESRFILSSRREALIRQNLNTHEEIIYPDILSTMNGTKCIQITQDGSRVFVVDQGSLKEFQFSKDNKTLDLVKDYGNHSIWCMKMDNDKKFLWTGGYDYVLRKWSVSGQELVKEIKGSHTSLIRMLRFTADGESLLTFQQNGILRKFNLDADEMYEYGMPKGPITEVPPKCAALSYDGKYLITGNTDNILQVWSTEDWTLEKDFGKICNNLSSIKITRDNKNFYAGGHLNMLMFNLKYLMLEKELGEICEGSIHCMMSIPTFE